MINKGKNVSSIILKPVSRIALDAWTTVRHAQRTKDNNGTTDEKASALARKQIDKLNTQSLRLTKELVLVKDKISTWDRNYDEEDKRPKAISTLRNILDVFQKSISKPAATIGGILGIGVMAGSIAVGAALLIILIATSLIPALTALNVSMATILSFLEAHGLAIVIVILSAVGVGIFTNLGSMAVDKVGSILEKIEDHQRDFIVDRLEAKKKKIENNLNLINADLKKKALAQGANAFSKLKTE